MSGDKMKQIIAPAAGLMLSACASFTGGASDARFEFVREVPLSVCEQERCRSTALALTDDGDHLVVAGTEGMVIIDTMAGDPEPVDPHTDRLKAIDVIEVLSNDRVIAHDDNYRKLSVVRLNERDIEAHWADEAVIAFDASSGGEAILMLHFGGIIRQDMSSFVETQLFDIDTAEDDVAEIVDNAEEIIVLPGDEHALLRDYSGLALVALDPFEIVWFKPPNDMPGTMSGFGETDVSADGQQIFTTDYDDVHVLDAMSGAYVAGFSLSEYDIKGVHPVPGTDEVLIETSWQVHVWDSSTEQELQVLSGSAKTIEHVTVSADGDTIAFMDFSQSVRIYRRN